MSTFEVKVRKITIEPHPDADLLEIGKVDDYNVVVGKGQFKTGDLVVYIPEASVVPDWLIERLGLVGKLAGSKHNRVKAVKFRGCTSQGLIVPLIIK
jgi:RNA ligase (TIGR02306 family)